MQLQDSFFTLFSKGEGDHAELLDNVSFSERYVNGSTRYLDPFPLSCVSNWLIGTAIPEGSPREWGYFSFYYNGLREGRVGLQRGQNFPWQVNRENVDIFSSS